MFANEGNRRLKGRAASFCMERSGYQEGGAPCRHTVCVLPTDAVHKPLPNLPNRAERSRFDLLLAEHDLGPAAVLRAQDDCGHTAAERSRVGDGVLGWLLRGRPERNRLVSSQRQRNRRECITWASCISLPFLPRRAVLLQVTVRFVNPRTVPVLLDLTVTGKGGCVSISSSSAFTAAVMVLHSANLFDANTPAEPTRVSPVRSAVTDLRNVPVPANSFVIVTVNGLQCD